MGLVLASLPSFLGDLIFVLSKVHDFADWRLSIWSDLYEIVTSFLSQTQCDIDRNNSDLLATSANQTNFRYPNTIVDSWFCGADNSSFQV
jgi:hypothetical protein